MGAQEKELPNELPNEKEKEKEKELPIVVDKLGKAWYNKMKD